MQKLNWKQGEFCWVDVMTTDQSKTKDFYKSLFNWTYEEVSTPDGPYVVTKIPEGSVGGIGDLPKAFQEQKVPFLQIVT